MQKLNDLSRCLTLEPDSTLIAVIEMSLSSWLVAGIVPGVERSPLKKLAVDESALLKLLNRWREEAEKSATSDRTDCSALEAGRDGFWLARWLGLATSRSISFHTSSVAVSREHWRAKTDRLDTELLKRAFLAGCAASVITARWSQSRQLRTKMASGQTASARASSRKRESIISTESKQHWSGSASAASIPS